MNSKHSLALSLIVSTLAMGSITQIQAATNDVTVYSSRKEHLIQPLFQQFTKQTGIEVNYLTGSGGDLIERLKLEGENTSLAFITICCNMYQRHGRYFIGIDVFVPTTKTVGSNLHALFSALDSCIVLFFSIHMLTRAGRFSGRILLQVLPTAHS